MRFASNKFIYATILFSGAISALAISFLHSMQLAWPNQSLWTIGIWALSIFLFLGAINIYPQGYKYGFASTSSQIKQGGVTIAFVIASKLADRYFSELVNLSLWMFFLGTIWGCSVMRAWYIFTSEPSNLPLDTDAE